MICALFTSVISMSAYAQLAQVAGTHYAARPSDTGFEGAGNSQGGYSASVPLDLPGARGGLPIPLRISYGGSRVGAAGLGWDIPLSRIFRDTTLAHRRPERQQLSLTVSGQSYVLVRNAADTAWIAQRNGQELLVADGGGGTLVMFDGKGRTYTFSTKGATAGSTLINGNLYLLTSIQGSDGNQVSLGYDIGAPTLPGGGTGLSINLKEVDYNVNPTLATCLKHRIVLSYGAASSTPLSMSILGGVVLARMQTLTSVNVGSRATCTDTSSTLLRSYAFNYAPDTDTQSPRLQSVTMTGRQGTPEQSIRLPLTAYSYGSIVDPTTHAITYELSANTGPPFVATKNFHTFGISYTTSIPTPEPHSSGDIVNDLFTSQAFIDLNGDGRPDFFGDGDYYPSVPGANSTTSLLTASASGFPIDPRGKIHSSLVGGNTPWRINPSSNDTLKMLIDMNGDGRLDVVETVLPDIDHWIIHLNTPDPTDPKKSVFVDITIPVTQMRAALNTTGLTFGRVPLARRTTVSETPSIDSLRNRTITEFELRDINGDGYPDFVYNASHVGSPQQDMTGSRNVMALINTAGVHLASQGTVTVFASAPITLEVGGTNGCGVSRWAAGDVTGGTVVQACGFEDVNGDGIPDRVHGVNQNGQYFAQAALGTGDPAHPYATDALISLPGPLSQTETGMTLIDLVQIRYYKPSACASSSPSPTYDIRRTRGLRDINGDGIPDYISKTDQGTWTVAMGTGTGFAAPVAVNSPVGLELSLERSVCGTVGTANEVSATPTGLYDIDGDGQPEIVSDANPTAAGAAGWNVYQLKAPAPQIDAGSVVSVPAAGRLTRIDNSYGASTRIAYKSAKEDTFTAHLLPYPEIVVSAVAVTDSADSRLVSTTRYAYGGAQLSFDSAADAFVFPGYQRTVALRGVDPAIATEVQATITDAYPLQPFVAASFPDAASRFKRYLRAGQVSDVTTLAGNIGTDVYSLLTTNISSNSNLRSGVHYEYDARMLPSGKAVGGNQFCVDMMLPYDYTGSNHQNSIGSDQCTLNGFIFQQKTTAWRGLPGFDSPFAGANATVKTQSTVRSVDDFGRVTELALLKDQSRTDDDLCVRTVYATPVGTGARMLNAVSSRATAGDDCTGTAPTLMSESIEYDTSAAGAKLPAGQVEAGFVTARTVSRHRTDDGTPINDSQGRSDIRLFDATYDSAGNPSTVMTVRDDGATSTQISQYDPFGLAPVSVNAVATNADGTNLPALLTSINRDPITLGILSITDPNGTQSGNTFDGFGRVLLSTVTPSGGGTSGALSSMTYLGFAINETGGRSVVQKVFTDPVAPSSVATAAGRTGTTFLDSLGRTLRTEVQLGADYSNKIMIVGQRTYDALGRVFFEADPFPSDQSFATAYGTTYYFSDDGKPDCVFRGRGQQTHSLANDEPTEHYPTCFVYSYFNSQEKIDVADPGYWLNASLNDGIPVYHSSLYSATGQLLTRFSWHYTADGDNVNRLEYMDFGYDHLGQMTRMTRYGNPLTLASPVDTVWKNDSLGRLLELTEPDSTTQFRTYDNWGEITQVQWNDAATSPPTDRRTTTRYDARGRRTHSEDRNNSVVDTDTVNDYLYDQPVNNTTPAVTATNVLGRISKATSPTSSTSFSYDGLGNVNAEVFTDKTTTTVYVGKQTSHGDGSPSGFDLLLPDTQFGKTEHVDYAYDSAGRTRSVTYSDGTITQPVFTASGSGALDVFGRIRQAQYGAAAYTADYAETGRRLINSVKVTSPAGGAGENSRTISFPAPTGFVTAFDPLGRERGRSETQIVNGTSTVSTQAFSYQLLGQLQSIARTPESTALPNMSFGYDPLGNIGSLAAATGTSGAVLSYQSVDRDRICSIAYGTGTPNTTCNVKYDSAGNITQQPARSAVLRTFTYFANGQVKRVTDNTGNDAQFRYDAFGNLEKLDLTSLTSGDTRHDRHFGGLISTRDEVVGGVKNTVITRAIEAPGVIATRHGSAASSPWTFAFNDGRGNRFFTDQTGAFVQNADYQAYGEAKSSGAQPGSPTYTSEQWNGGDALTALGLSQLGARLYDPVIGRFLTRDPLILPRTAATTNPYSFANNDPVNFHDPSGMSAGDDDPPEQCACSGGPDIGISTGPGQDPSGPDQTPAGPPGPPPSDAPQYPTLPPDPVGPGLSDPGISAEYGGGIPAAPESSPVQETYPWSGYTPSPMASPGSSDFGYGSGGGYGGVTPSSGSGANGFGPALPVYLEPTIVGEGSNARVSDAAAGILNALLKEGYGVDVDLRDAEIKFDPEAGKNDPAHTAATTFGLLSRRYTITLYSSQQAWNSMQAIQQLAVLGHEGTHIVQGESLPLGSSHFDYGLVAFALGIIKGQNNYIPPRSLENTAFKNFGALSLRYSPEQIAVWTEQQIYKRYWH